MHTSPLPSLESLPPTQPHPTLSVITERRAGLPALRSSFPLAVYFTHGGVYVKATLSVPPPSPSPAASTGPLSILQSTRDGIYSMGLGKCIVIHVCH